jgi:hypothetical protein
MSERHKRRCRVVVVGLLGAGLWTGAAQASVYGKVQSRDWSGELARIQSAAAGAVKDGLRNVSSQPLRMSVTQARPEGKITGIFSGREVSLAYEREHDGMSGVYGTMGPDRVQAAYFHDKRIIAAFLNNSSVDLEVKDDRSALVYTGNTRAINSESRPASLTLRWVEGTLEGEFDGAKVSLFIERVPGKDEALRIQGIAQMSAVDLVCSRVPDGALRVQGRMNRAPLDLTVRDMSWSEFLRYFFVFLGETRALPR